MICVEKITITPSRVQLHRGDRYSGLSVEVLPANATCKTVKWESRNPDVVSINETTGVMHARKIGNSKITASAVDGSFEVDSITVVVTPRLVEDITLDCSSATLEVGETQALVATVSPSNATNKDIVWASENTGIATVDDNGMVRAIAPGSTTITATAADGSGVSDSVNVTVRQLVADIKFNNSSTTVDVGETITLTAIVSPTNATNQSISWESNNPNIATVSGNGKVTGVSKGTTTITATATDGSGISCSCTIKVLLRENITVKRDGNFNKIIFNSSGKEWLCMNYDLINDWQNLNAQEHTELLDRLYTSTYEIFYRDHNIPIVSQPILYSENEMKLLYLIDPHGFAAYVQEYAKHVYSGNLTNVVNFKDSVFEVLFNKAQNILHVMIKTNGKT